MNSSKTYPDKNGYLRFKDTNKLFHKWVKEKELGRHLLRGEIVHHINGNILDNRPKNLEILTAKEHYKIHVVPILEARKEAQITERLIPILEAQMIKGLGMFFTIFGIAMFILGLIFRGKIAMWYLGLGFVLMGLIIFVIQRIEKREQPSIDE